MLSIPIINEMSTKNTRKDYADELRRAGADRVFIAPENPFGQEPDITHIIDLLRENIIYYTDAGFETAVWINGLGHGGMLNHEKKCRTGQYTRLRGLSDGSEADDSFCPLDPDFAAMYRDFIRRIAETGARMIMIDDDLRMALHGPVALACTCERHMELFNRKTLEAGIKDGPYTREMLADILFSGKASRLRSLWLQVMGDTLRDFCASLRKTVDEVDPCIRLGHCACLCTWDTDGVDSIELSYILAGRTKPFLRLIGAPYWRNHDNFNTTGIGSIIDIERMQMQWCSSYPDIEIFSEGDVYPRPRYVTPAAYVEAFDQVLTAEGYHNGILKYMLDYTFPPKYETGYIDRHLYYAPLRNSLSKAFEGKENAGIFVCEHMHMLEAMDIDGFSETELASRFVPASVNFANACGLPISFRRTPYTGAAIVFGENAKYADKEINGLPLILDAAAAKIFQKSGTDVGIRSAQRMSPPQNESFSAGKTASVGKSGAYYRLDIDSKAKVFSYYDNGAPASYLYKNDNGLRVFVLAFDAERANANSELFLSYYRKKELQDVLRLLQGTPLPAMIKNQPSVYFLCRKDEESLTVGLWNFGQDIILPSPVLLDDEYCEAEYFGDCPGVLKGDKVIPQEAIVPYGFFGFTVKK